MYPTLTLKCVKKNNSVMLFQEDGKVYFEMNSESSADDASLESVVRSSLRLVQQYITLIAFI